MHLLITRTIFMLILIFVSLFFWLQKQKKLVLANTVITVGRSLMEGRVAFQEAARQRETCIAIMRTISIRFHYTPENMTPLCDHNIVFASLFFMALLFVLIFRCFLRGLGLVHDFLVWNSLAKVKKVKSRMWQMANGYTNTETGPRGNQQLWRHLDEFGRSASRAPENKPERNKTNVSISNSRYCSIYSKPSISNSRHRSTKTIKKNKLFES
jgi:hypothetical protein